jgi:hypothetical protein
MVRVAESALRAEPHGQLPDFKQWSAPLRYEDSGFLPRRGRRTGGTSDALNRSVNPAELAQARIFTSALQVELARLTELASGLGGPPENSKAAEPRREHRELGPIHAGIDEVRHLLEGLRGRFGMAD